MLSRCDSGAHWRSDSTWNKGQAAAVCTMSSPHLVGRSFHGICRLLPCAAPLPLLGRGAVTHLGV